MAEIEYRRVDEIIVEGRHRRNLGDLSELAASIKSIGVINPVTVTPDNRLIAGHRRLEAQRRLGWTSIKVRVVDTLTTATDLLIAERDENTCRLAMKPSELVSLGRALEELERPKAEERKAEGQALGGAIKNEVLDDPETIKHSGEKAATRDVVGKALGVSGATYSRAKAVIDATAHPDPEVRAVAEEAAAEMDATGKVTPAYNKVAAATGKKPHAAVRPKPADGRPPKPTVYGTRRKHAQMLDALTTTLAGHALALEELTALDESVTAEEATRLTGDLSESIRVLTRINKLLKERTTP